MIPSPLPIGYTYIGNGSNDPQFHPTPWANPFSHKATSAQDAALLFEEYALARADAEE